LDSRGFRVSRSKTEYLHCCFSGREGVGGDITIDGVPIPKVEKFRYLGSMVQQNGENLMKILTSALKLVG